MQGSTWLKEDTLQTQPLWPCVELFEEQWPSSECSSPARIHCSTGRNPDLQEHFLSCRQAPNWLSRASLTAAANAAEAKATAPVGGRCLPIPLSSWCLEARLTPSEQAVPTFMEINWKLRHLQVFVSQPLEQTICKPGTHRTLNSSQQRLTDTGNKLMGINGEGGWKRRDKLEVRINIYTLLYFK